MSNREVHSHRTPYEVWQAGVNAIQNIKLHSRNWKFEFANSIMVTCDSKVHSLFYILYNYRLIFFIL